MQVIFIIFCCIEGYNSLSDPTRQHKVWRKTLVTILAELVFSTYRTKFNAKITKMKQNYMANMIVNVPETVCQFIHYFPCKEGLTIILIWPTLKSKQHMCIELFNIIS